VIVTEPGGLITLPPGYEGDSHVYSVNEIKCNKKTGYFTTVEINEDELSPQSIKTMRKILFERPVPGSTTGQIFDALRKMGSNANIIIVFNSKDQSLKHKWTLKAMEEEEEAEKRKEEESLGIDLQQLVDRIKQGCHEIILAFGTSPQLLSTLRLRALKLLAGCQIEIIRNVVHGAFQGLHNYERIMSAQDASRGIGTTPCNVYIVSKITCNGKTGYLTTINSDSEDCESVDVMKEIILGFPARSDSPVTRKIFSELQNMGEKPTFTVVFYPPAKQLAQTWTVQR
jgi:hypothetical protein